MREGRYLYRVVAAPSLSLALALIHIHAHTRSPHSGSDGLIKLWTIKTNECVETFDQHTDKVWALAVSPSEQFVVSGGSDSVINLWRDDSKEKEDLRAHEEEQKIVLTQELSNHLLHKNYRGALRLAIQLKQVRYVLGE